MLLILYCHIGEAQNVSAYLAECESSDLHEAIKCSDIKISEYFLKDIDKDLCPEDDAPNIYSVSFRVNLDGETMVSKIYANPYRQIPCLDYFQERASRLTDFIEFIPAVRNDADVTTTTSFKITYPDKNGQEVEEQASKSYLPIFSGCSDLIASEINKKECANSEYLKFIYSHMRYPKKARQREITGTVVVKFKVDKIGNIKDIELLKDIGYDCGDEALRVVHELAKLDQPFIPGYKDGEVADYIMTLPIKFNLGIISSY